VCGWVHNDISLLLIIRRPEVHKQDEEINVDITTALNDANTKKQGHVALTMD
jgi:hypothetical protein